MLPEKRPRSAGRPRCLRKLVPKYDAWPGNNALIDTVFSPNLLHWLPWPDSLALSRLAARPRTHSHHPNAPLSDPRECVVKWAIVDSRSNAWFVAERAAIVLTWIVRELTDPKRVWVIRWIATGYSVKLPVIRHNYIVAATVQPRFSLMRVMYSLCRIFSQSDMGYSCGNYGGFYFLRLGRRSQNSWVTLRYARKWPGDGTLSSLFG